MSLGSAASLLVAPALLLAAAAEDGRLTVRDQGLTAAFTARTPDQISAFYAARGFPPGAVERISQACFITVSLRNDSGRVLWLEPGEWRMLDPQGRALPRVARPEWEELWDRIELPAANRSTFGWTLLPESRDLQPGEAVGGNLTLARPAGEFTLIARFAAGQDRRGGAVSLRVPGLRCATGDSAS